MSLIPVIVTSNIGYIISQPLYIDNQSTATLFERCLDQGRKSIGLSGQTQIRLIGPQMQPQCYQAQISYLCRKDKITH